MVRVSAEKNQTKPNYIILASDMIRTIKDAPKIILSTPYPSPMCHVKITRCLRQPCLLDHIHVVTMLPEDARSDMCAEDNLDQQLTAAQKEADQAMEKVEQAVKKLQALQSKYMATNGSNCKSIPPPLVSIRPCLHTSLSSSPAAPPTPPPISKLFPKLKRSHC